MAGQPGSLGRSGYLHTVEPPLLMRINLHDSRVLHSQLDVAMAQGAQRSEDLGEHELLARIGSGALLRAHGVPLFVREFLSG